jgi:hypothetical protein
MRVSPFAVLLLVAALGLVADPAAAEGPAAETSVSDTRKLQALTTINKAKSGSKTFALEDSYDCDNGMVATVRKFFKANDATFDTCISESGYQMYPYTGVVPDARIVTGLINSNACMGIITAVVLLNMPPCLLDDLPMRAACETVVFYSVALRNGVEAPTADEFFQLMAWRRDVNLARAAKKPFDGESTTYLTFTKTVRKALSSSKVSVMDNFTVVLDEEEADSIEMKDGVQPSFVSTNSSVDYFVGKVGPAADALDDAPVTTASSTVSTESSDASTRTAASATLAVMLALAALV